MTLWARVFHAQRVYFSRVCFDIPRTWKSVLRWKHVIILLFYKIINNIGWLKIKLHGESKWYRRYCTLDGDKSVFFIASKIDSRYKNWIKLLSNILIHEYDCSINNELNNHSLLTNTIEISIDSMINNLFSFIFLW